MILKDLPKEHRIYYKSMLEAIGALSRLFSDSNTPYLEYRIAENLYCKAFNAKNVSRSDASVDAVYDDIGIGIKTFQGKSAQKIAEFNKDRSLYKDLPDEEKVLKISELRNARLEATLRIYGLKGMIYHCVKRCEGKIIIHEYPMDLINIGKIKKIKKKKNVISFEDDKNKYSFNLSKSVLMRKFNDENPIYSIDVKIVDDPFKLLEESISRYLPKSKIAELYDYIILPLYSQTRDNKFVPEKSGLNQWNASGRKRHFNEVYVPIPIWIHRIFPDFFPPRDISFDLKLPNDEVMSAKVCQDDSKALMSNPNKALGNWILREILKLKEGELLTYAKLQTIGIDSVIIKKIDEKNYMIDFRERETYEKFLEDNKNSL
jgi:hypothetical protein